MHVRCSGFKFLGLLSVDIGRPIGPDIAAPEGLQRKETNEASVRGSFYVAVACGGSDVVRPRRTPIFTRENRSLRVSVSDSE